MTEQKHTRGPWFFDINNDAITTEERKRTSKTLIATVELGWAEPFESEQFANAQLITTAPDLLKALERLVFAAECRDNTSGDAVRLVEVKAELAAAAKQARIAIAKATGGSND